MASAIATEVRTPFHVRALPVLGLAAVAALSFAAVAGWIAYGEAIYIDALANGWAACI